MDFRKFLSYLSPSVLESVRGTLTERLSVVYMDGWYRLSAPGADYSYGGCMSVFSNVFKNIGFENYEPESALILGLGAGGVVALMGETYGKYPLTVGVEGDPTVLALARKYFGIERFQNLRIVEADALEYAKSCGDTYDLIIIDLFVNDIVPAKFHTPAFVAALRHLAHPESLVIFNKMTHREELKEEFVALASEFEKLFPCVGVVQTVVNGKENSLVVCNSLKRA